MGFWKQNRVTRRSKIRTHSFSEVFPKQQFETKHKIVFEIPDDLVVHISADKRAGSAVFSRNGFLRKN